MLSIVYYSLIAGLGEAAICNKYLKRKDGWPESGGCGRHVTSH
jgi:hypothetical protein